MTDFPDLKIKVLPTFPSNIVGGAGIETIKQNGHVVIDLAHGEFGLQSAIPTSPTNTILTYDTATGQYINIPSSLLGGAVAGISDAPVNSVMYGRYNASWVALADYASRAVLAATNVPPATAFVRTAGYSAAGDGGGALHRKVGSAPAHPGKVQSADGAWWELVTDRPNIKMFGAVCDWNGTTGTNDAPAIQAAVDWVSAQGGGTILFPAGARIALATMIVVQNPNTCLASASGTSETSHNANRQTILGSSATVYWTGAVNGWMFIFLPHQVSGSWATAQTLTGVGMKGIALNGLDIAGVGIIAYSIRDSLFDNLYLQGFKSAAIDLGVIPSLNGGLAIGDPSDIQFCKFSNIVFNQIASAGTCLELDSWMDDALPNGGANVSLNTFTNLSGFTSLTAAGIVLKGADNNVWTNCRIYNAGTQYNWDFQLGPDGPGASYPTNSEHLYACSGSMIVRSGVFGISIYGLDKGNASPDPVLEAGATAQWTTTDGKLVRWEGFGAWVAYTPTLASSGGAVSSPTSDAASNKVGKTIYFRATVTYAGGSGILRVGLPTAPLNKAFVFKAIDLSSGEILNAYANGGLQYANVYLTTGGYPTPGHVIVVQGEYEGP